MLTTLTGTITPDKGARVTHDLPLRAGSCLHPRMARVHHRNGVCTGAVRGFGRALRPEVLWDCGCYTWPLLWMLRPVEVPAQWRDAYQGGTETFRDVESIIAAYYATGLPGEVAATWAARGFTAAEALPWIRERYSPDQADEAWSRGCITPEQVRAAEAARQRHPARPARR